MSAVITARPVRRADGVDQVRALQRMLYRSAKQDRGRRFHALYDKLARSDVMWRAWSDVAANRGAAGVDGVTIDSLAAGGVEAVKVFLDELAVKLRAGTYRPAPLRRVHIPKPGRRGATRPLGIPTVTDRVVMSAAKIVLEPIFEADFLPVSFGFRPKRSAHQALEAVRQAANRGGRWVLDADIEACFDNIDHDALMGLVERRVVDRPMLKLLRSWLRAGIFEGGIVSSQEAGTPQGSPISPLLANIALSVLDEAWANDGGDECGVLVRYADDLVVLSPTRARARQARALIQDHLDGLGLRLHPDKTRVVDLERGKEGFDFLGFHHRKRESWKWRGHFYLHRWPAKRAMASIRAKIRFHTDRRWASLPLQRAVEFLNSVLRGWGAYFRYGNSSSKFNAIDSYVHERMAILASTKHGLTGRNWVSRFTYDWLHPARDLPPRRQGQLPACARLPVNDVGEPCAGEPHARFDRGPLARGPRDQQGNDEKAEAQRRPRPGPATRGLPHSRSGPSVTHQQDGNSRLVQEGRIDSGA
jgi:RNA-directed DNA polymerase